MQSQNKRFNTPSKSQPLHRHPSQLTRALPAPINSLSSLSPIGSLSPLSRQAAEIEFDRKANCLINELQLSFRRSISPLRPRPPEPPRPPLILLDRSAPQARRRRNQVSGQMKLTPQARLVQGIKVFTSQSSEPKTPNSTPHTMYPPSLPGPPPFPIFAVPPAPSAPQEWTDVGQKTTTPAVKPGQTPNPNKTTKTPTASILQPHPLDPASPLAVLAPSGQPVAEDFEKRLAKQHQRLLKAYSLSPLSPLTGPLPPHKAALTARNGMV